MNLSHVRRGAYSMVTTLAVALTGCGDDPVAPGGGGGGGGGGGPVATTSVTIADNSFTPAAILVAAGATVTWTWTGAAQHDVTFSAASGLGSSVTQTSGMFAEPMPAVTGTYSYECTVHSGMTGTVTVQ